MACFNQRAPPGGRQPPAILLTCQRLRAVLRERAAAGVPNSTYIVAHRRQPTLHIGVISFREPPRFPMSASPSRSLHHQRPLRVVRRLRPHMLHPPLPVVPKKIKSQTVVGGADLLHQVRPHPADSAPAPRISPPLPPPGPAGADPPPSPYSRRTPPPPASSRRLPNYFQRNGGYPSRSPRTNLASTIACTCGINPNATFSY